MTVITGQETIPPTYALQVHPGGELRASDHLDVLVATLPGMEGYLGIDRLDAEASLVARTEMSLQVAEAYQSKLVSDAIDRGDLDLSRLDGPVLEGLVESRATAFAIETWTHPVPLVTISTLYEPFTGHPTPRGNVVVIDPYTERSLLESLAAIGLLDLHVREPRPTDAEPGPTDLDGADDPDLT